MTASAPPCLPGAALRDGRGAPAAAATSPEPRARPTKPLGHKAYGSIPHLPGSRMGPADYHCHEGQRVICWEKARDRHDRIIVTEKLDGSNVCAANINGAIVALGRAGYLAATSPYEQHHLFAEWVAANEGRFLDALRPGERLVGEWLAQAHGTRYEIRREPFVVFDMLLGQARTPHDAMTTAAMKSDFETAHVLSDGAPRHLDEILPLLAISNHGALDPVEGAVWRVERRGAFDFIAKWVRPEKVDGCLLPDVNGSGVTVWNWRPGA